MKAQLLHIKEIYRYATVPLKIWSTSKYDDIATTIVVAKGREYWKGINSNRWRKIMNPMIVKYQTCREKSFSMSRPIIMVGEVHYGQNLWLPSSTKIQIQNVTAYYILNYKQFYRLCSLIITMRIQIKICKLKFMGGRRKEKGQVWLQ
jgi:hypothetical protein